MIGGRDPQRGREVCRELSAASSNNSIEFIILDLESADSVRAFVEVVCEKIDELYCLVNNAACFYLSPKITLDGLERTFQTNFLSHIYLTNSLLPLLEKGSGQSRIINVSSAGHLQADKLPDWKFHKEFVDCVKNRFGAYFYSKLCLVAYGWELRNQLKSDSVSVHCVDPGNSETPIYRHFPILNNPVSFCLQKPLRYFLIKTPKEGAQGILHAVLSRKPLPFYIKNIEESNEVNPLIYDSQKWKDLSQECTTLCLGWTKNED